jgi:two-component sensor histidine kinase
VNLGARRSGSALRYAIELLGVAIAYFTAAKLGLALASINPSATPIWPPAGMALAAVLLLGYRVWPAVFVAALLANATTAGSASTSAAIALGNTLECLVGGMLVNRWAGGSAAFEAPGRVIRFTLIVLLLATPISATMGGGALFLAGYAEAENLLRIWLTWWLGDFAGVLVIAPVLILWLGDRTRAFDIGDLKTTGVVLAGACIVGIVAFSPLLGRSAYRDTLGFLAVVPLLWAALQGDQRDTASSVVILAAFAIWGTALEGGPFARSTLNDSFLLLLMFIISISVPSLVLSADVAVRRRTQDAQRLLAAELSHRVKNTLATVQAITLQTLHGAPTPKDFHDTFTTRLQALSQAHDLLSRHAWRNASLGEIVKLVLAPYDASRAVLGGPDIRLAPNASVTLTMALHELATNAAKYGALSAPNGRVSVTWTHAQSTGSVEIRWTESGGPAIEAPRRRGFGLRLIQDGLTSEFEGEVRLDFAPHGLDCHIRLPISGLVFPA